MKAPKVWIVLALVFGAGFTGGVVATTVVARRAVANALANPDLVRVRIERELDRRLRLDPRQRREVHEILAESHDRMKVLRKEFQPQFALIVDETTEKISAVLNVEQQKKFERLQAEHRVWFPQRPPPQRIGEPRPGTESQ